MGDVYRALDTRLDRRVALKFLPRWLGRDPAARARLRVEARIVSSLDHPNVCTLFEIAESEDGRLFLAMPLYDGETLKARIGRGPLAPDEALDIALQAAEGLAAAHEHGIVHRDIKPANLLVTSSGQVKLLDFGVAKLADLSLTQTGRTPGTTAYMSPEQAGGRDVDARTDLWSLGAVLFEMLTGRRPFDGDHPLAVVRAIEHEEPPPVSEALPGVDPAVEAALDGLLAKSPDDRFASARALIDYLRSPATAVERPPVRRGPLPAGETRQVTAGVILLSGYPALVERHGPALARRRIERIRERVRAIVERSGGMVNRCDGEECVCLFGVLAVREDDPVRAVRAMLEVHEAVRSLETESAANPDAGSAEPLEVRTGVDTDRVLVRPVRDGTPRFEVLGSAVRRATRLASSAFVGELRVSSASQELIEPYFRTEPLPPLPVSGSEAALASFVVRGASGKESRFDVAVAFGLTPFTGREREVERFRESLAASAGGAGRILFIRGEAGIGKSRLLHEFRRSVDVARVEVLHGRCSSLDGKTAYHPFVEIVRRRLGLDASAEPDRPADDLAWGALGRRVRGVDPELVPFLPFYAHLLSIEIPGDHDLSRELRGQQQTVFEEAIVQLVLRTGGLRTTMLVLEDWQWADRPSTGVLDRLREIVTEHSLLVVVTTRTIRSEAEADSRSDIVLEPFAAEGTRAMLCAMLGVEGLPRSLVALLGERTGGNPFFLEETCRALLESGDLRVDGGRVTVDTGFDTGRLPPTVEAVILSRLDRLDREAQEVIRLASVVGQESSLEVLRLACRNPERLEGALRTLVRSGLLAPRRSGARTVFQFRHALVREAAYASELEHRRRELHRRVGEAIESLAGDAARVHAERLMHHFGRAGVWEAAARYGVLSAPRAYDLNQFDESLAILDRVGGWLERLPEGPRRRALHIERLLRAEEVHEVLGQRDRQQAILDELVDLLDPAVDRELLAEGYLRRGDLHILLNRHEAAERALRRSLDICREDGDLVGERKALRSLGLLRYRQLRPDEAVAFNERALAIDRRLGDEAAAVGDLANIGHVLTSFGRLDRARSVLEEALRCTEPDGVVAEADAERDPWSRARAVVLHNLARVYARLGHADLAAAAADRAVRASAGHHDLIGEGYHAMVQASVGIETGRIEAGLAAYEHALDKFERVSFAPGVARAHQELGRVRLELGDYDAACRNLAEAVGGFERLHDRDATVAAGAELTRALNSLGIGQWEGGRFTEALDSFRSGLEWAERTGDAGAAAQLECSVGVTLKALGRRREARTALEGALARARASGHLSQAAYALSALADLSLEDGRPELALEQYEAALAIRRERGDRAGEAWMLHGLARAGAAAGRRPAARAWLDRAAELAADLADAELAAACEALYRAGAPGAREGGETSDHPTGEATCRDSSSNAT